MSAATKTANVLNPAIFGLEVKNQDLLKQTYHSYLAEKRQGARATLTRGLVRGGGKKPWKQKGTGRARVGSIRSPLWRGGGITFGPTGSENNVIKVSKQAKRTAVKQALSLANADGRIKTIPNFLVDDGKTRSAVKALADAGAEGRTLVVVPSKDETTLRAVRNIQDVQIVRALYLTVYDILHAKTILITDESLPVIEGWLGGAR